MPQLEWVRKIFDDGMHNAFTDLKFWKGYYYVSFRRAEQHGIWPHGDVVIIRSADLENWEVCGMLTTGLDDRDPKMAVDGDRLWVFFGSWHMEVDRDCKLVEDGKRWIESHASFTTNGTSWEVAKSLYKPGWWLWRPERFEDAFYCAAYGEYLGTGAGDFDVDLLKSADGYHWEKVTTMIGDQEGDETGLFRYPDGRMLAVVRSKGDQTHLMESQPPYTDWSRWTVRHWIHAPVIAEVDGRIVTVGRFKVTTDEAGQPLDPVRYVTRLWELKDHTTHFLLELPSGGDTSYCGFVVPDEKTLLISYYSQHEFVDTPDFRHGHKPAAIYMAKVSF